MANITKYLLVTICSIGLMSCSARSNPLKIKGKWINLNVCGPNDILLYDFSNNRLTTLDNKTYSFKISPDAITIQFDSAVFVPYRNILVNGDTLKIILDEQTKVSLLKFHSYRAMDSFTHDDLYGIKYETEYSRKWKVYWNFLNKDLLVVTEVDIISNDTITSVFPYHQYNVENASILHFSNIFCSTFLLATKSNDTIRAFTAYNYTIYPCKIFTYKDSIKAKASRETLTGYWKVIRCSDPEAQNFVSLRFSQSELNVGGMHSGVYTSQYFLDLLGRVVLGNFDDFELNKIEIVDIKGDKLIVTANGVRYILGRVAKR